MAVLIGLLLAVVIAEGLLRATGAGSYSARSDDYGFRVLSDEPLYWGFDPGHTPSHTWDGDPYGTLPPGARMTYPHIGEDGLRGPDVAADESRPIALVVGDSFTFGEGVPLEETFVHRAESLLAERGSTPARLVNAGIPGYGTLEETARLPSLAERLRPRVVVLVFVPNDPIHVSDSVDQVGDLIQSPGRGETGLEIVRRLQQLTGASAATRATEDWYLDHYVGDRSQAWLTAQTQIGVAHAPLRTSGCALGVAYFPLLHDLTGGRLDPIRDEVARFCRADGIPFRDLGVTLRDRAPRDLWVHPIDHHPNARAHEAVAPAIADLVTELLGE